VRSRAEAWNPASGRPVRASPHPGRPVSRIVASGLFVSLALLTGCAADAPEGQADVPLSEVDEGWVVHEAEPEAGEDHPGSLLLTRRAEPGEGPRPRLVLGCEEGVTLAYVEWGTDLGAGDLAVTYRLDGGPEQAARWRVSDDREAAGLWADSTSVPFVRSLLGHDRLSMDVTPKGGGPLAGRFALDGLDSLVAPVQVLCGWE